MSNSPTVTVQYAIVHITDRHAAAPLCSEIDLDLGASGVLRDYFTDQVQHALDDESTGGAKFATTEPHDAMNACNRILASQASFVSASQELARLLHAAMKTHARIAPGSLAVCLYTEGENDGRHLALIKLDPGNALVMKVGTRDGKKLVTFDVQKNVMPTAREKLHKAALLPPVGSRSYDLLLLDRQTPQVAAAWWAETFLNAILIVDGKVGATGFNDANHNAYLRLIKTGKTAAADAVKEQGRIELGNRRLRRSAYLARLPQDARDIVDEELEKRFAGTKTIPIDVEFASENLTKKTRFRGKYGVVFEVETKNYDKVVREKTTFTDADNTEITRFVLEIPELQQMK